MSDSGMKIGSTIILGLGGTERGGILITYMTDTQIKFHSTAPLLTVIRSDAHLPSFFEDVTGLGIDLSSMDLMCFQLFSCLAQVCM